MAQVFVSYSHSPRDQAALANLVAHLEARGLTVWWDAKLQNDGGWELNKEIADAIDSAEVVVALLSSQSGASGYCLAEIAYGLERGKKMLRIDIEPIATPAEALPLAAVKKIDLHGVDWIEVRSQIDKALLVQGIQIRCEDSRAMGSSAPSFDDPALAIIRPSFAELQRAGPDRSRQIAQRLTRAASLNPANGFNALSLSFVWMYLLDARRASGCAAQAVQMLPVEPNAHYAVALSLCMSVSFDRRTRDEVEDILRTLAVARRLANPGAHLDLLTASVIANYYLPRYITPPIEPEQLLNSCLREGRHIDLEECRRAWIIEPVRAAGFALSSSLLAKFGV